MALTSTDRLEEFLSDPGLVPAFVEGNRTRSALSGIDPSEYTEVTAGLTEAADWPATCVAAGQRHLDLARQAADGGRAVTAAGAFRDASRWFHLATCVPHPDADGHRRAAGLAWDCLVDGLTAAGVTAQQLEVAGPSGSRGLLRRPADAAGRTPLVVIVPGLDSSTAEFAGLADMLVARGLATLSLDGPGQGVRSLVTPARADYERVFSSALDALGPRAELDLDRIGVVGLSLGGFYAPRVAAHEPRVRAVATVTGPYRLGPWEQLWPLVRHIIRVRTMDVSENDPVDAAAREFTERITLDGMAERVHQPLLVVAGGRDQLCTVEEARRLVAEAPAGRLLLVEDGDHLCANTPWRWRPRLADWFAEQLAG